jgi:hypothetical protein
VILIYKIDPVPFLVDSAFNVIACSFTSLFDLSLLAEISFPVY